MTFYFTHCVYSKNVRMVTVFSDLDADISIESYSGEELKIVRSILLKSFIRRCSYI